MAINHLPHPLGSLVLWKGARFYITFIHKYTGTYDLVYEKGNVLGGRGYNVSHSEVQLLFPPVTSCDWNKMLEANLK